MADTRFWRFLAAALVAALFYIGHGLNNGTSPLPSLTTELQAGDIATTNQSGSIKIMTVADEGKTIRVWRTTTGSNAVQFLGVFTAMK